jgi:hypothetical protein
MVAPPEESPVPHPKTYTNADAPQTRAKPAPRRPRAAEPRHELGADPSPQSEPSRLGSRIAKLKSLADYVAEIRASVHRVDHDVFGGANDAGTVARLDRGGSLLAQFDDGIDNLEAELDALHDAAARLANP